jgi:hypothetical protein
MGPGQAPALVTAYYAYGNQTSRALNPRAVKFSHYVGPTGLHFGFYSAILVSGQFFVSEPTSSIQ